VIHHVFACKSNIGDWLSARAIQVLLAPLPVVEHLCDAPFRDRALSALQRLSPTDTIVIGGGGLLMDYFDPFWAALLPIAARVPTVIWGVGLCDHEHGESRPDRSVVQSVFAAAKVASVRDDLTVAFLDGRVEGPVACPSMTLLSPAAAARPGVLHVHHRGLGTEDRYLAIRSTLAEFAASVGGALDELNNRIPDGDARAMDAMLDRYRAADVVVSSRLHGCIIAVALGKKTLAIPGDRKVESFMHAAGLADWIWRDGSADTLSSMLRALPGQPDTSGFVSRHAAMNREVATRVAALAEASRR
jgi:polysaccharide pyruvyl transferase WcaK-like protein